MSHQIIDHRSAMKRARQDHQKLERREAILAAGLALLDELPFQEITMTRIAERAGVVKGTLYLYFATREELFLELLGEQLHDWFWDQESLAGNLPRASRLDAAARQIGASVRQRPVLRGLLGVLDSHLLHNVPEPAVRAFQEELRRRAHALGTLWERALPFLRPGQGFAFLVRTMALVTGLQGRFADPELLTESLRLLLLGLREANRG
ncbi:TetR family transcriptional regulator [uncultured Tolumonas sp.]|uniref:TetR family transcriptional regulator n=1 Tax=uncultured Tolumonas sp. TaxID=263765 RepID=UPI00292E937F|nr:TetR family transcriptional regulator [uncultured Tolumonas sp.]